MKHIVLTDPIDGVSIRPPETLERLRDLSIEESQRLLSGDVELVEIPCPACAHMGATPWFDQFGFQYRKCHRCGSAFLSPRPTAEALTRFHAESGANKLRVEYYLADAANGRLAQVTQSRVDWVAQIVGAGQGAGRTFVDVGTLYPQMFAEVRSSSLFAEHFSMEPPAEVAAALVADGVGIGAPEPGSASVITAFEQFERQADPVAFVQQLRDLLIEGGVLFITTRTITGFDLQVLGRNSPDIFVPEHLNLLSVEGLSTFFAENGFELIELSTPGRLDVELVRDALERDPTIPMPAFVRYLIEHRGENAHEELQGFLQKHRLSSHVRVAARKVSS